MVTLSHDAQGHLERYLKQVRAALRGHAAVDADEVERDVRGHIDAELAGQPEPIGVNNLRRVLDRLGAPDRWVPAEELPLWRRGLIGLHSGPEDWRLSYLTFASFASGFWFPPFLILSLALARATLAQLESRDEPIGPRSWLVYPPLVLWYLGLALLVLMGPAMAIIVALEDPVFRDQPRAFLPEPVWLAFSAAIGLTLGVWWIVLCLLLNRFRGVVHAVFWPFADWFNQRHARRVRNAGILLIVVSAAVLATLVAWHSTPTAAAAEQTAPPRPAVPIEPIAGILDAFRSHQVVALGEGTHNNEQGHAFRLALLRDPRFGATVNDIVVESGNARYQEVMDRFVRGEDVPHESLRRVWQNTTQPDAMWDTPIYEEMFRAVRSVNASLPRERQLRVLLGDPPIDWDAVRTAKDYGPWDRDGHPVDLIRRDVIAKGRRALVIYGDLHFIRKNPQGHDPAASARSIVGLLESSGDTKVFSIRTIAYGIDLEKLQADVLTWPRPSLTRLRGTVLGAASFSSYYPRPLLIGTDGKPVETPEQRRPLRMEEQFDALLYLGPQSVITRSALPRTLCADPAYMEMRLGRLALLGLQAGVDRLKQYCDSMVPKSR